MTSRSRHFGIVSPPVSGHLNPFGALGRELLRRGHRVTLLHMPDIAVKARAQGLAFIALGHSDHPLGSLPESLARLGRLQGFPALNFTIRAVARTTEMFCRDSPAAIRASGIDALLVDQTEPVGSSLAAHLGLPFITICNALPMNRDNRVPPPFTNWTCSTSPLAQARNSLGYKISDLVTQPILRVIRKYRKLWNLPPLRNAEESFSPLAQISQLIREFDYPRPTLPDTFHYTGPLRDLSSGTETFPWERLDGRPLIYASLGTLQNARAPVFQIFAEACRHKEVQLVITHGGGMTDAEAAALPGNPVVVPYAPQRQVLERAALTVTHAGLNTVLDSLACGVPMVALPIAYEQPAIAERVRHFGLGEIIPFKQLTADRLAATIDRVLASPQYRNNAKRLAQSAKAAGGTPAAADIVESVL